MRRLALALALAMLLALGASGANEFAVVVPSGATGVYGVIVNPANQAQGHDITTDDARAYNRALSDIDAAKLYRYGLQSKKILNVGGGSPKTHNGQFIGAN